MDRRKITIILLTLVIVLIIAIIIFFLFFFKFPGATIPKVENNQPVKTETQNTIPEAIGTTSKQAVVTKKTDAQPATSADVSQANLKKTAASFAERLGSYSNQSNFSNISDLKIQMTRSMQEWADNYVATNKKTVVTSGYEGVTTHSISSEMVKFDDTAGVAEVVVHTQHVTVKGESDPVTSDQDITISFVKEGKNWLVDFAKWKK